MADVVITMESDVAKLLRDQEKINARQEKQIAKLRETVRESKKLETQARRTGKTVEDGAGKGASSMRSLSTSIAASASGMATFATAATGALMIMREIAAESERAAQSLTSAEGDLAQLAQLPGGRDAFLKRTATARRLVSEGGARDLAEAGRLVFALESAGAGRETTLFSQLGATRLVSDPAAFAKAAATINTALGVEETGGFRALTSKAFAASAFSPAQADRLLEAAAKAGAPAGALGFTDEAVLAASAVLSSAKGSAQEGGSRLAALLRSLPAEFRKESLAASVEAMSGMSGDKLRDALGSAEAVEAQQILAKNFETFAKAQEQIIAAERTDLVAQKLAIAVADPAVRAAREARIFEGRQILAAEEAGRTALMRDAEISRIQIEGRATGRSEVALSGQRFVGQRAAEIGLGPRSTGIVSELTPWLMGALNIITGGGRTGQRSAAQAAAAFSPAQRRAASVPQE